MLSLSLLVVNVTGLAVNLMCFWRGGRGHRPDASDRAAKSTPSDKDIKAQFRFIEHVPVPLIILDEKGRPISINTRVKAHFGEALGAILRHPTFQAAVKVAQPAFPTSVRLELDVPVRRVLRAQFNAWCDDTVQSGRAPRKFVIVVLDDHTETAAAQLLQADFVAYASHELKTPLASIAASVETILGPAADDLPAQKEFLAIMSRQIARMGRLIDRLLHLSRAQRLVHARPITKLDLNAFWPRLQEEVAGLNRQYAGRVEMENKVVSAQFIGDADQLTQLVLNLVENALKYSGPQCTARVTVDEDSEAGIVFAVTDNGPGIAARHLLRLTEPFYRAAPEGIDGSGLGLSIAKLIVDRHAGRLKIISEKGQGFCCKVWLPNSSENCDQNFTLSQDF